MARFSVVLVGVLSALFSVSLTARDFDSEFVAAELQRARTDPDNSTMLDVGQPIELVFDALLVRLPEYTDDIAEISFDHRNAEITGVLGVGSERITTMEDGGILVQRIIEMDPPRSFAYFTDMSKSTVNAPIDYSIGYYRFRAQPDNRVEARVSVVYKASSRFTALFVRLGFGRALARDFRRAEEYLNSLGESN